MTPNDHVFLTGGTGFFGRALLRYWSQLWPNAPRLTILSRDPKRFRAAHPDLCRLPGLRLLQGDICFPASLPQGEKFTYVLHAAADSRLGPQLTPLQHYAQIVDGTRHMLDYAVAHGIKRFLLTSSGGAYGPQPLGMERISEEYNGMPDPLNTLHTYSVAKRCAEHLCALYRDKHGLEVVIARCFTFVGRDLPMNVHFAVGNFIRDALGETEIAVSGDGTPIRSYMDQRDLAHWLTTLLEHGRAGQAYNVGSDQAITIRDLAHLVRDTLAPDKPIRIAGEPPLSNFRSRYVPSIDKARKELGLSLAHTLESAVRETALRAGKS